MIKLVRKVGTEMKFLIIILILIIAVGLFFIFQIKMNNGFGKKHEKFSLVKKEEVPPLSESNEVKNVVESNGDVEVLDLNDKSKNSIEEKADTLDLDDLFKTISLSKVEEEKEFDFDLKRSDENKTA